MPKPTCSADAMRSAFSETESARENATLSHDQHRVVDLGAALAAHHPAVVGAEAAVHRVDRDGDGLPGNRRQQLPLVLLRDAADTLECRDVVTRLLGIALPTRQNFF